MTSAVYLPLASSNSAATYSIVGPTVIAVRGPSRSGKTAMCERLVPALASHGLRVAWMKRTHHGVDVRGKASDRVWNVGPAATALRANDRLVITLPSGGAGPSEMIAALPGDLDVILLETHEAVEYPTILSNQLTPGDDEAVIGRWDLFSEDSAVRNVLPRIKEQLPVDRTLDMAFRSALRLHGGHGCAGLVLGTRLALAGANALGIPVPDTQKRLIVVSETDRCAVDGIQAVTGCRPGKRTLRLLDYGKLAATFLDERSGRSVRVATRGDLRKRVGATGEGRHAVQRAAYASWPVEDLFTIRDASFDLSQYDRPGPPRIRVICGSCDEEVSDGRHTNTELGPQCLPCGLVPVFATKGVLA